MSKPGLLQIIKSVLAAGFGVQSSKNRETDFEHGTLSNYIIVGFIATALFVLTIIAIVSVVTG